jgi:dienelactone hydrolase
MILIYISYIFFVIFYLTLIILNNEKKYFSINTKFLKKIVINIFLITLIFIIILPMGKFNIKLYNYKVGTKTIQLINSDRKDEFNKNDYRKIKLRIFYPIDDKGKKYANLFVDKDIIDNLENLSKDEKILIKYLKNQKINTYLGKDLKSDLSEIPIVIISHKMGYLSEYYVGISEKLASLGYFVIAINHTYMSKFTEIDNEIVYSNKSDFKTETFQLSYLYDILDVINFIEVANKEDYNYRLNTDDMSVIGHGISGGIAMNIAFEDNRINNVIAIDPIIYNSDENNNNNYNLLVFKSSEFDDNQLLLDTIIEKNNGYVDIYENNDSISKDFTSLSYISPFSNFLGLTRKSFIKEVHNMEIDFLKKH